MTNQQQAPVMPNWSLEDQFAYHLALLFAKDPGNPKVAMDTLVRVNKRLASEMKIGLKALRDSSGLPNWSPAEKLTFYYSKPDSIIEAQQRAMLPPEDPMFVAAVHSWESFKGRLPREYQRCWGEFQQLRDRAYEGKLGPELQMREVMLRASTSLPAGGIAAPASGVPPGRPIIGQQL